MRLTLLSVLCLAAVSRAEDPPAEKPDPAAVLKAELKVRAEKYLDAGIPGVFTSDEKDLKNGRIERAFVVGVSPISTVLGADEGLEIAKERAEESAKTEFVKWLGSKVTVRKTVKNETLLTKEGEEKSDGTANTKELGKRVERRTKEFEETASHLVSGMKVVAVHQMAKEKKLVIVYRWDAATAAAVGKIGDPKSDAKKPLGKIPDKKVIIDD